MRIYLVQSGTELKGVAGYSYGLLTGGHNRLLCSFVDFMHSGRTAIFDQNTNINRRRLSKRALAQLENQNEPVAGE